MLRWVRNIIFMLRRVRNIVFTLRTLLNMANLLRTGPQPGVCETTQRCLPGAKPDNGLSPGVASPVIEYELLERR